VKIFPRWVSPQRAAIVAASALTLLNATAAFAVGDEVSVNIVDAPRPQPKWGYAPATRRIAPGTWVTWSNDGQDAHSVTAVDGSFDSGNLDPSEGFSWFFDQPGTFLYVCTLHTWMTGKIIVGDGVAPTPTPDPSEDPPSDAQA
jgi:plastocyanin